MPENVTIKHKMFPDHPAEHANKNITAALRRLNAVYPEIAKRKSLDECVELRIINNLVSRALMYKIDEDLPENIRTAIRETLLDQARKLRMEVITQ